MPMLERAVAAGSDDPTLEAIETIRAALTAVVAEDLAADAEAREHVDEDPVAGPLRHGKIRRSSPPSAQAGLRHRGFGSA